MIEKSIKKILIIKHGSFGDIVFALEAMYSIRKHFQNSKIFLLTESKFKKFMTDSKFFDEIIIDNRENFFDSFKILKELIKYNFDLIIDLQNSQRSNIYNFFMRYLSNSLINGHRFNSHYKYKKKLEGLESPKLGLINQIKLLGVDIFLDNYKWLITDIYIKNIKDLILIVPSVSSSGKHKQWPQEKFIDLCIKLENIGKQVCLVGTEKDREVTNQIVKKCNNIFDLTGKSPPEIIYTIALNCKLVVTNDTGPGHIAALTKNKIIWLAIDNITTKVNIENNNINQKILSDKIENIPVELVFNKIKDNL